MSMEYIRKTYGVPAKRGMKVRPKSGARAGQVGYIRGSSAATLIIVDVPSGRYGWYSVYHPEDLTYMPHNPLN